MTRPRSEESDWERRRRRAEVFGEALPETTKDERDDAARDKARESESPSDRWLREQIPPHHGS
ncbi:MULTISPECIES: hypothetical protein [unclassified Nocardioides]|uniref:hypothetical protein n=1 Tax=unclassified Nocardioides TaxID=2615069 RepID=UPI0002F65C90|nr:MULTISPECIES: hypothetical protein [unclassified Nocardioides]